MTTKDPEPAELPDGDEPEGLPDDLAEVVRGLVKEELRKATTESPTLPSAPEEKPPSYREIEARMAKMVEKKIGELKAKEPPSAEPKAEPAPEPEEPPKRRGSWQERVARMWA